MIQIGAAALLAEYGIPESVEMGLRLIRHELETYVNLNGRVPGLPEYDFWEAVDDDGRPYEENGNILSDPGHVLEFIGLTLKFTSAVREKALAGTEQRKEIVGVEAHMPALLEHTFARGFPQPGPGGICKVFDLVSRTPANTDMPWWNLPETLRRRRVLRFDSPIRRTPAESPWHIQRLPQRFYTALCPPGPPSDGVSDPR